MNKDEMLKYSLKLNIHRIFTKKSTWCLFGVGIIHYSLWNLVNRC